MYCRSKGHCSVERIGMRAAGKQKGACRGFASAAVGFTSPCPFLEREGCHRQRRRLTYASLRLQKGKKKEEDRKRKEKGRDVSVGSTARIPLSPPRRERSLSETRGRARQRRITRTCEPYAIIALEGSERRHGGWCFCVTAISYRQQFSPRPRSVAAPGEYASTANYTSRG